LDQAEATAFKGGDMRADIGQCSLVERD